MDFKINIEELEDVLTSLHKMKASLETLDRVLVNVQNAIAQQQGKLAEALTMEFGAHRDDISRQQGTVTRLFKYLENYVADLKSIDSPVYRKQDMLIDARGLQKLAEQEAEQLENAKNEIFRVPLPTIEQIPDDPDELWVMRHNQELLEDMDDYIRRKLNQLQQNEGESMRRISQDMRRLMEMDQVHATQIEKDYRQYDRNKVREVAASTRDTVIGFGLGAIDSLKHPEKQLEGLASLFVNLKSDSSGTLNMLWGSVVESYLEPYKSGDAYGLTKTSILFAGTIGITKGISDISKLSGVNKVVTSTEGLLKQTTCSPDELFKYLNGINKDAAQVYLKTGKWPDGVQIPKNSGVLTLEGRIDWAQVPKDGFKLDALGNPIKEAYIPKVGEIIDRYGPVEGRFTSPLDKKGRPFSYDKRSLPYIEDMSKYHQYKITGNFKNIKKYYDECLNIELKNDIDDYMNTWGLTFEELAIQKGGIAKGFGVGGGGVQYQLPLPASMLEGLNLLKIL
ncbi:TNT domain-containing protein [Listeria sp. FSL L7-1582]|uniref:glycohydrolase toxin TNT-related protein n=1 Tax=Listeria portnoyi TaxID=2713504 RepID=UPI00164EAA45|nr:glycohydrolase toxin TNT-related protein [Listeria portnoyi]MBC6310959.1 TNT domain-containing protein [Listeria portnoyi]